MKSHIFPEITKVGFKSKKLPDLKVEARRFYNDIVSVDCPILGDSVHFPKHNFLHLIYDTNQKPRNINEQYLKLHCLYYAPEVINKCAEISEAREIMKKYKGKIKTAYHYQLTHEVTTGEIFRVVIEKVGNGIFKFLSVMPHKKRKKLKRRP